MATKASKKKINVLIADDQTLFREGIKDLLDGEKVILEVDDDGMDLFQAFARLG